MALALACRGYLERIDSARTITQALFWGAWALGVAAVLLGRRCLPWTRVGLQGVVGGVAVLLLHDGRLAIGAVGDEPGSPGLMMAGAGVLAVVGAAGLTPRAGRSVDAAIAATGVAVLVAVIGVTLALGVGSPRVRQERSIEDYTESVLVLDTVWPVVVAFVVAPVVAGVAASVRGGDTPS